METGIEPATSSLGKWAAFDNKQHLWLHESMAGLQPTTQLLLSQDQQYSKAREQESLVIARPSGRAGRDSADY
jgi:hypothetical protein